MTLCTRPSRTWCDPNFITAHPMDTEFICLNCLQDSHLRRELPKEDESCDFCDSPGPSVRLDEVASSCDQVLDAHFETTNGDESVWLYGRDPGGTDLEETLAGLKVVADEAVEQLAEALRAYWFDRDTGESKYSDDGDVYPCFRPRSDLGGSMSQTWERIHDSLQHEARYLNPAASQLLDQVFGDVHADHTVEGQPVVVDAGPGSAIERLFRARTFQADDPLIEALERPELLLGTPAQGKGPAGRMNARGQPTFYGASTVDVAVAEVRPPVGSKVVTAAFDLTRPLKLLDFRQLGKLKLDTRLSLFDPRSIERAQRRDFLRQLVGTLVQPVMPESQDRDYLATQVIADYLATHREGPIDGVIYDSVQRRVWPWEPGRNGEAATVGFNVALFPRASQVKGADGRQTAHAALYKWEDDGPGFYLAPAISAIPEAAKVREEPWTLAPGNASKARRLDALELVLPSIKVHEVKAVEIKTYSREVEVSSPPG